MDAVKISPKYQVVIPQKARDKLNLAPGQRVQVIVYENRIELIPERKMKHMRGFLKGMKTAVERDSDRV